jgi:hypothetical protein
MVLLSFFGLVSEITTIAASYILSYWPFIQHYNLCSQKGVFILYVLKLYRRHS